MPQVANSLLSSRKVWLAVIGVITAIVSHYLEVPQDVWVPIEGLLLTVIITITVEDSATKLSGRTPGAEE